MAKRKSDSLWKVALEDLFPDLLRFIFSDADQVYDMARGFEFLEKELIELDPEPDEEKDSRFADKLIKVYHRDGLEEWVLLHIEIQGYTSNRDAFAVRMFEYYYRIRDRHPGMLVSALAIFTGQDAQLMPKIYKHDYRGTKILYEYPTLSILDYTDEELDNSPNPFAQLLLIARLSLKERKIPEDQLFKAKLQIARKLKGRGFSEDKLRAIFIFLRNYVRFEDDENYSKFDNALKNDKSSIMNTVEYIKEEAKEEAFKTVIANLLKRFGFSYPVTEIASMAGVPERLVNEVKKELNTH